MQAGGLGGPQDALDLHGERVAGRRLGAGVDLELLGDRRDRIAERVQQRSVRQGCREHGTGKQDHIGRHARDATRAVRSTASGERPIPPRAARRRHPTAGVRSIASATASPAVSDAPAAHRSENAGASRRRRSRSTARPCAARSAASGEAPMEAYSAVAAAMSRTARSASSRSSATSPSRSRLAAIPGRLPASHCRPRLCSSSACAWSWPPRLSARAARLVDEDGDAPRVPELSLNRERLLEEPRGDGVLSLLARDRTELGQRERGHSPFPGGVRELEAAMEQVAGAGEVARVLLDEREVGERVRLAPRVGDRPKRLGSLPQQRARVVATPLGVRQHAEVDDQQRRLSGVIHLLLEREAPAEKSSCGGIVALEEGEPPGAGERACARRGIGVAGIDRQQPLGVLAPFGELASDLPEAPQGAHQAKAPLDLAPRLKPGERFTQIVVVLAELAHPDGLPRAAQLGLGLLGKPEEEPRVPLPRDLLRLAERQPLEPVLPDRLEHAQPRSARRLGAARRRGSSPRAPAASPRCGADPPGRSRRARHAAVNPPRNTASRGKSSRSSRARSSWLHSIVARSVL